jgi:hypothetical protein
MCGVWLCWMWLCWMWLCWMWIVQGMSGDALRGTGCRALLAGRAG